jgi:hypothetical protein
MDAKYSTQEPPRILADVLSSETPYLDELFDTLQGGSIEMSFNRTETHRCIFEEHIIASGPSMITRDGIHVKIKFSEEL